jgi:phage/plasmid-like protein (TIGR03299 family)
VSRHKKSRDGTTTWHASSAPPNDIWPRAVKGLEAKLLGWQKTSWGDIFSLYNILKIGHPSYQSTVVEETLRALHLHIPRTSSPYLDVKPSPWHNLGTELANPATAREAIKAAGLNYTVVKKPLKEVVDLSPPADLSDRWATVRTDTGDVLGIVGDGYEVIQNKDAFKFFDTLVGTDDAMYETAGVIGRGERMWILAKPPGFIKVHGNDIVSKYLLLTNSHDGSSRVRVKLTPIPVVCNNTLTAALQGTGEVHVRHTVHAAEDMEQALSLLGLSDTLYQHLDATLNRMALTKTSDKQLLNYVRALVPDNEEGEDNAKNQGIRKAVHELYESGQGADLSRGTLWGAFNCVTEYTDHEMEENPTTRLESIWFGRGEQLKLKAFELAGRMM